jgi:hypothetical protein
VKGNALAGPVQIHSQLIRSFTENRQEILFWDEKYGTEARGMLWPGRYRFTVSWSARSLKTFKPFYLEMKKTVGGECSGRTDIDSQSADPRVHWEPSSDFI